MNLSAKLNTALAKGFNFRWNYFGTESDTTALCCCTGPLLDPFSQSSISLIPGVQAFHFLNTKLETMDSVTFA